MDIRLATERDVDRLQDLLFAVQNLHAEGRPDVFIKNSRKYTHQKVREIIACESSPVFVGEIDGRVMAYAFCEILCNTGTDNLKNLKTLYLDDLCVDKEFRGKGYGKEIYEWVKAYAKQEGCYHLTLNVWYLNQSAVKFYERVGMKPLKTTMEEIL